MSPKSKRALLLGLMNVALVIALALVARVGVEFFGAAAASAPGKAIIEFTHYFVPGFGLRGITTPYGGVFDVNATVMIGGLLVLDWVLGMSRRHV